MIRQSTTSAPKPIAFPRTRGGDPAISEFKRYVLDFTNTDITKDYTMIELQADIGVKTAFLRKIAQWSSYDWEYDDVYTVNYKSVLGYLW